MAELTFRQKLRAFSAPQVWVVLLFFLLITMVVVGGLTRLTGSGLSMVTWKVWGGTYPLSSDSWNSLFVAYQASPEFQLINSSMSLQQFKVIFTWEYMHRMLGRLIGLTALLPLIWFSFKRSLSSSQKRLGWLITGLICFQGWLGWFMVQSGLVDVPEVSHFRLASHLSMAFIIIGCVVWQACSMVWPRKIESYSRPFFKRSVVLISAIFLQIIYGAFVAGLKAGKFFNTFPKMGDNWIPDIAFKGVSIGAAVVNNPFMIQFIHRWLAMIVLAITVVVCTYFILNASQRQLRVAAQWMLGLVIFQVVLGIGTLMMSVPMSLGSLHQVTGLALVVCSVIIVYFSRFESLRHNI